MNWIETSSKFRYCGKPVIRRKAVCKTVSGTFEVYEAVSGKTFIRHPWVVSEYIGPAGFDNGMAEWFGPPKDQVENFDAGKAECQRVLEKVISKLQATV